jgi:hypothetical protein
MKILKRLLKRPRERIHPSSVPRDVWVRVIAAAVEHVRDQHRIQTILRITAVSKTLMDAALGAPELWTNIIVPAARDATVISVCRLLARLPRDSIETLGTRGAICINAAFRTTLDRHAGSLEHLEVAAAPGSLRLSTLSMLRSLRTLCLAVDMIHSTLGTLPPLPELRAVRLDISHGTVGDAPSVLGNQPALMDVMLHAEHTSLFLEPSHPVEPITPWLARHPKLRSLHLSMFHGDLNTVLQPTDTLFGMTMLNINVYRQPSAYEFVQSFPDLVSVAILVHRRLEIAAPTPVRADAFRHWSPALRTVKLKRVNLGPDGIPIQGLTTLETLYLKYCGVTTLTGLTQLRALKDLYVEGCLVTLDGVGSLTALESLDAVSHHLEHAGDLHSLRGLKFLKLDVSQWWNARTHWQTHAFTSSLVAMCLSDSAVDVFPEDMPIAPFDSLRKLVVTGGSAHAVGPFLEAVAMKAQNKVPKMKWIGGSGITLEFERHYPRATSVLCGRST